MKSNFKFYLKKTFRGIFRFLGFDIISFDPRFSQEARKMVLLQRYIVSHLLDIGANEGQFARYIRNMGFSGSIYSFEPVRSSFMLLEKASQNDSKWTVVNVGFGEVSATKTINVSRNSVSSSLLRTLSSHTDVHPESAIDYREDVMISTVDEFILETGFNCRRTMMKIDTQGFEMEVLKGSLNSLQDFAIVLLELSVVRLYEGQTLMSEIIDFMYRHGFQLAILEPCDCDFRTLTILQFDGWFVRRELDDVIDA